MKAVQKYQTAVIGEQTYVSVKDAADHLGVSESLVYRTFQKRENPLRTTEFGGRVVIEVESLEAEKARRDAKAAEATR